MVLHFAATVIEVQSIILEQPFLARHLMVLREAFFRRARVHLGVVNAWFPLKSEILQLFP